MGIKRDTWERDLHRYVTEVRGASFEWGVLDCTSFVVKCLEKMTDQELITPLFTYTSKDEAIELAKHWSLPREMQKQLGAYEVLKGFQAVGDIIVIQENPDYLCAHICLGRFSAACMPDKGVVIFPTKLLTNSEHPTVILRFD